MTPLEHAEQIKRLADEYGDARAKLAAYAPYGIKDFERERALAEERKAALHAAIESLAQRCAAAEAKLAEAEADARRWRAFCEFSVGFTPQEEPDWVDITFEPAGWNGRPWHRAEIAWRIGTRDKASMDAAIDQAMEGTNK